MTTLYARRITLRNCGRFSVVLSDFGADYRTHTHVTGEALYASLTRGATWWPRPIVVQQDKYDFTRDYRVEEMPLWFTPGVFHHEERDPHLPAEDLDATFFNAVSEAYPTTSQAYGFDRKSDRLRRIPSGRPNHVPTYGTWQAVLPDHRLITYAFSPRRKLLESFIKSQTFLLGKKRTMFQIIALSDVIKGAVKEGQCTTTYLQIPSNNSTRFQSFEVLAATMRYVILRGTTREEMEYIEFPFSGGPVCLPDFYLEQTPLLFTHT
jgi:hypothetical protein